ncbi:MAG: ABC transporter permease [Alphaproteobacteria bacterium]|jgi:peptide/nickel transport system permease protein|nr:ABC transporter permease [Alphaproteobacteria bacterium]MDP6829769.1 ABC transporter permease [Alphaproteobacteria bacterium]
MRYILRRLRRLCIVMFAVTLLTFLLVNVLPGDIAYDIAGQDASEEDVQAIREDLGLNRPVLVRYISWLSGVFVGDWGASFRTGEPVLEAITSRFPVSLELMLFAQLLALLLAVPLGVVSAYRAGSRLDRGIAAAGFAAVSMPAFMVAILLILLFSMYLSVLPATGYEPISEGLWANLRGMILPALSIALAEWTILMRTLRAEMIGVLQEDYIALARAKGMADWHILVVHALRPSSFTLITLMGLQVGNLIGGSIIIESIFGIPGVGRLLINAIYARDFIVIQGCVTFIAIAYVLANFLVDMAYALLDPRIRVSAQHG